MRLPSKEEVESWTALARDYGFLNEEGEIGLGRFVTEPGEEGYINVRFITPVPAGLYTEDTIKPKTPPVMFGRTPAGEIILPGRWWASCFKALSEDPDVPDDVRQSALSVSRFCRIADALLPPETDTIEILCPDDKGQMVPHEALIPGGVCQIRLRAV